MSSQEPRGKVPGNLEQPDKGLYETTEYETVGPNPNVSDDTKYLIRPEYFGQIIQGIEGQILTLIDASTEDKEKRESLKSLARQIIWQKADGVRLLRLKKIKNK